MSTVNRSLVCCACMRSWECKNVESFETVLASSSVRAENENYRPVKGDWSHKPSPSEKILRGGACKTMGPLHERGSLSLKKREIA